MGSVLRASSWPLLQLKCNFKDQQESADLVYVPFNNIVSDGL